MFPHDDHLARWIRLAQKQVTFQGLPARICWLGYGERVKAGLKFNELVATGLRENKDLLIATARIDEFAGNYGFVRSGLFPQIGAGYEASRQQNVRTDVVGASANNVYNSYDIALGASWEIDIWGRIRRQTEAARAQLLATEEGRSAVVLSLVGSVAGAYTNLRSLDHFIALRSAPNAHFSIRRIARRVAEQVRQALEKNNIPTVEAKLGQMPSATVKLDEAKHQGVFFFGHLKDRGRHIR